MKKNRYSNENNIKEIYKRVNHNKYSQIIDISGNAEVKSNAKNLLYNYKFIIITISILLLIVF